MPVYDLQVLIAAYLHAHNPGLTQKELGDRAGLGTQTQVSRLLGDARREGYLHNVFTFPEGISEEQRRLIEQASFRRHTELEEALVERSRDLADTRRGGASPFQRLHIVPSLQAEVFDPERQAESFALFGQGAAEIVREYITKARTCCVAWGRTLEATLKFVQEDSKGGWSKIFIPIAGEPTNHEPSGVSPSDAARMLARRWPGSESLSLRGVQARIPKSVFIRDTQGIAKDLARHSRDYCRIFGPLEAQERPLIARVDMILAGIGDTTTSAEDPWYLESREAEDAAVLEKAQGNIGGIWLAQPDLSAEDAKQVDQMNDRWLGAQLEHFERCSRGADLRRDRPGVVILAVEPGKAGIILEALDLINVLVVSYPLARELERRVLPAAEEDPSSRSVSG